MMLFACSMVTCVLSGGRSSRAVVVQPSSNASRSMVSNRPSGLMPAPRPLRASACLPLTVFRGTDGNLNAVERALHGTSGFVQNVRVDHRGGRVLMAEQFLDCSDVSAVVA